MKFIAAFGAVFVLGGITGAAVGHVVEAQRAIDLFDGSSEKSRHGVWLWSLERKLDLSGDQKAKIEEILTRYDREMADANAPVEAQTTAVRSKMRAEVRGLLAADQQKKFDALMASRDAMRARSTRTEAAP